MHAGAAVDLALRETLHVLQPPELSPQLHANQAPFPWSRSTDRARSPARPDDPDPAPGGPLFNRRRRTSIQAAPTSEWQARRSLLFTRRAGADDHLPLTGSAAPG